ncbi:hypothetical protein RND71_012033 [Anisodus tanguticus]|uniref:Uncharacterized protein n=1 Tax=Anisodus tanguticus TaxID=243964 RepID=A0AAE1SG31_9SOLA|nr:hypothetical protein RND71_012033 [Anisodus tanguticus]
MMHNYAKAFGESISLRQLKYSLFIQSKYEYVVGNLPLVGRLRPPIFNDLNTRVPHIGGFVSSHVHNLLSEWMTVGPRIVKFREEMKEILVHERLSTLPHFFAPLMQIMICTYSEMLDRPAVWNITDIVRQEKLDFLSELSRCLLRRVLENSHQEKKWGEFLGFLQKHKRIAIIVDMIMKVATGKHECFQFFVLPPKEGSGFSCTFACYREREKPSEGPVGKASGSTSYMIEDACSPSNKEAVVGHTHSGWIFGAIAEFVDNSRDAKATKLEISIDMIFSKAVGREIPMLCIIDDGCGMNHQEMLPMVSFGHRQPDEDDANRIGRFGIGFKTGAMKLRKDALNLEIPIVSYYRNGQFMELDKQNETLFKHNLKAIKEFAPFDKYFIGQKGDILIRSRRVRACPGQMTQMVKSRPLSRSLIKTVVENGFILRWVAVNWNGKKQIVECLCTGMDV